MRFLFLILPAVLIISGCCTRFTTSVKNESGRDIRLTLTREANPIETITIPASSKGWCRGVMPTDLQGTPESWIIFDGETEYAFMDVSPIAKMPRQFVSQSRLTSDFPCKRVTQHVRIAPDMTIHAVRVIGYTESQPPQFPIHYTTKE